MESSDEDLVRRFLDGEAPAFDQIVLRYQREIYRIAWRFTGNHAEADDLAQETFCRAYTALAEFRGEASLRTWLCRIVANLSLNVVQSSRVARRDAEPVETVVERGAHAASGAPGGDAALIAREEGGRLREAIGRLPPKQRATLMLRAFEEMPYREIAAIMGCTIGTAKANFFHAVSFLRRELKDGR